jgi:hypothetical protein
MFPPASKKVATGGPSGSKGKRSVCGSSDTVRAQPDIQHRDTGAAGNGAHFAGEQIGEVMKVIRPAGDRWAEIPGRKVPVRHAIVMAQQGGVEGGDGGGIGKIDRVITGGIGSEKFLQGGKCLNERGETVTPRMAAAGVQGGGAREVRLQLNAAMAARAGGRDHGHDSGGAEGRVAPE